MQFGIFSIGDVTPDPVTGNTFSEAERIQAMVTIALTAEEVGLDVFATGEHHNPPFVPSSPTTMLGYIAVRTERIILSTATDEAGMLTYRELRSDEHLPGGARQCSTFALPSSRAGGAARRASDDRRAPVRSRARHGSEGAQLVT